MPPGLGHSRALPPPSDNDLHHPGLQRWPGSSLRAGRGADPSLFPRVEPTAQCGRRRPGRGSLPRRGLAGSREKPCSIRNGSRA